MNVSRIQIWILALATAACMQLTAGPARAADKDDELRKEVLGLNSVTGTDQINARVREWADKKELARTEKRLEKAEEILKADPKAIKYPCAVIVANVARVLKKFDLSIRFYK